MFDNCGQDVLNDDRERTNRTLSVIFVFYCVEKEGYLRKKELRLFSEIKTKGSFKILKKVTKILSINKDLIVYIQGDVQRQRKTCMLLKSKIMS